MACRGERLLLSHVGDGGHLRDGLDLGQLFDLAAILEVVLELEGRVEVILDGALVAPGHEDDLSRPEATASSTTYWMVGLSRGAASPWLGLGRRQEAGAEPGRGEDRLANTRHTRASCGLR